MYVNAKAELVILAVGSGKIFAVVCEFNTGHSSIGKQVAQAYAGLGITAGL